MNTRRVDVVLPCLDEAGALPWVLSRLPAGWRALVVDNGSVDGSADVARAHGATVVTERRRGFGAAAHAGLRAAETDLVAFADADASLDLAELPAMARRVAAGEVDLLLGRRVPTEPGAWPWHARLANRYLAGRISPPGGPRLHDLGPMRVAPRERLLELGIEDRRSGYPLEMVVRAVAAGWTVGEVEVAYRPRIGRSKVTGSARGTATAVRDMTRVLSELGR